ncbi:unnamed protein product [Hydatigera taeniaeformis]|uniref:Vesicle transport protein USE1 n=1 Tax=Hydatigena taeniaeformis TaxID=6205 RepID=A0A0R3WME0_HYDTA|nr:unnamed protein product [Hydatigera taeniaeformis]
MLEGSVIEANFVRLLDCAEIISASDKLTCDEFLSYRRKLQELYNSLTKASLRPAAEYLHIYKSRVDHLSEAKERCSLIDSAEEIESINVFEKDMCKWLNFDTQAKRFSLRSRKAVFFTRSASDFSKWLDEPDNKTSNKQGFGRDAPDCHVHQRAKPKSENTRFLLDVPNSHCRHRDVDDEAARMNLDLEGDGDSKIKGQERSLLDVEILERDKIAKGMLYLTEELRSTQLALGDRVRADINTLNVSSTVAQVNVESLASISRRVREELGHKFGLCIWILFLLSVIVFFWMVLFIRFTPKGRALS